MAKENQNVFENLNLSFDKPDMSPYYQSLWKAEKEFQNAVPPSEKDIPPMIKALGKSSDYLNIGLEDGQINISYNEGRLSQYRIGNITFNFSDNGNYTKSSHDYEHSIQYDSDGRKLREVMEGVEFSYSDKGKVKNITFYHNEDRRRVFDLMNEVAQADNIDKYKKTKDGISSQHSPMEQRFIDLALDKRAKEMALALGKFIETSR